MSKEVGSLSTRYEKDYSQLTDAEKFYKAINDCKEYLGNEKFDEIVEAARAEKPPLVMFTNMMGFMAGVEGYPVEAMYAYMFGFDSVKPEPEKPVLNADQFQADMEGSYMDPKTWGIGVDEELEDNNE